MPPSEGWKRTPCSAIQSEHRLRLVDHEAGERLVGVAAGHAQEVVAEFLLGIGPGQILGRRIMGAAHIAGVAGVAAAIEFRRNFQHQHRGAGPPRADRGTQCGIAAADHQHVKFTIEIRHSRVVSLVSQRNQAPCSRGSRHRAASRRASCRRGDGRRRRVRAIERRRRHDAAVGREHQPESGRRLVAGLTIRKVDASGVKVPNSARRG